MSTDPAFVDPVPVDPGPVDPGPVDPGHVDPASVQSHWDELVTAALLGTDRRDPPQPIGLMAELVADTARTAPSERMLAHVAACTAVRRAGVLPAPAAAPLASPPTDDRPPCPAGAVERWHHITNSWPVLEDEWMLALVGCGWRAAPELAPVMLRRHRSDQRRFSVACVAIGPLASWLVEQLPELVAASPRGKWRVPPARDVADPAGLLDPAETADLADPADVIGELPELPIPGDLRPLLSVPGAESGGVIAIGLERGRFGAAHRGVLVNLLARLRPDALADLADVIDAVDPMSPGYGLATVLSDLAATRRRMLAELDPGGPATAPQS